MTAYPIPNPFSSFVGLTGLPLTGAKIYIGEPGQDPETHPIAVYQDAALTIGFTQPIRTNGGYLVGVGTPANAYPVSTPYSIRVRNSANVEVFYLATVHDEIADLFAIFAAAAGSGLVGFSQANTYASGTVGAKLKQIISVKDAPYNAKGDGVTDDSSAIQAAITAAGDGLLHFPSGTYKINTGLVAYNGGAGDYVQTGSWFGDGATLLYTGSNGAAVSVKKASTDYTTFQGVYGFKMRGIGIRCQSGATQNAIYLRGAFAVDISDCTFDGGSGDAIRIECSVGDLDACNTVRFNQVKVMNWTGRPFNIGDAGHNETSYVTFDQCRFEACTSPAKWVGQILKLRQSAFVLMTGTGAFEIPGQTGSAQDALLEQVTFENCAGIDCKVSGIVGFTAVKCQSYHSNAHTGTNGFVFDGSAYAISKVSIDDPTIRATVSNNAFTAFKISGVNTQFETCRVTNVYWSDFDYTGQTRFDGWHFDNVPQNCGLLYSTPTSMEFQPLTIGRGNFTPLRLRGPGAAGTGKAAFSTSGEWVASDVSGVSLANTGLANSTRYYVYLYDNNGAKALVASTVAPALDSATGYRIASGTVTTSGDAATMLYVGSVVTDGSAQFAASATGWANASLNYFASQNGVPVYLWSDSTNRLRIKSTAPTSDTDGTVVGTQV